MALVRWNPWTTLPTLQDRINRLFEDAVPATESREDVGLFEWRPMVDTYEKDDAIMIKAELPGVKKDDISIDVNNGVLSIKGERSHEDDVNEENYYRRERFYGKFQRAFTLPDNADADKIEAGFKDGVLEVKVPKTEQSKGKKVEIK
ncbi:HSP20 family protein [Desulfosalsimonas propionicica]|uniref:HSP20 family protein n=1 Tax=Desulfosalsimonas propionicica TaxID=332175 RepID=A0A7W0CBM6_9BACT|nr:Hsp20/alpha crystallin family protein [Desulfosalsimonas propionicica]MBA2882750.1 HSP20 family protein [Desulfosalsimonas propionicica]